MPTTEPTRKFPEGFNPTPPMYIVYLGTGDRKEINGALFQELRSKRNRARIKQLSEDKLLALHEDFDGAVEARWGIPWWEVLVLEGGREGLNEIINRVLSNALGDAVLDHVAFVTASFGERSTEADRRFATVVELCTTATGLVIEVDTGWSTSEDDLTDDEPHTHCVGGRPYFEFHLLPALQLTS